MICFLKSVVIAIINTTIFILTYFILFILSKYNINSAIFIVSLIVFPYVIIQYYMHKFNIQYIKRILASVQTILLTFGCGLLYWYLLKGQNTTDDDIMGLYAICCIHALWISFPLIIFIVIYAIKVISSCKKHKS